MERKFYTNDFEQLLKENADQFKMLPSKKVWHGIYNDRHPGRRWPSIAMSLIFVFTLMLVGHLNTQQIKQGYSSNISRENQIISATGDDISSTPASKNSSINKKAAFNRNNRPIDHSTTEEIKVVTVAAKSKPVAALSPLNNAAVSSTPKNRESTVAGVSAPDNKSQVATGGNVAQKDINTATDKNINFPALKITPAEQALQTTVGSLQPSPASSMVGDLTKKKKESASAVAKSTVNDTKPKAVKVSRIKIHKNAKVGWAYYLSPGLGYRNYSKQGSISDQSLLGYASTNLSLKKVVTHHLAPALEAGVAMKYSLSKKLKFTSGFQVNYSAYTIQANNIHPIIATLILHNEKTGMPYRVSAISYFGNGPGNVPVNLHNYSVQIALPIGLEYELAGNDHVQFSASASFQPSLLLANKAYILSTDKRNYLTDASLTRHWNMGTNIGTFVSFNSAKFKWQIGPQVRYQLLSSYGNEYQVKEHFIDYNIRVAISR